MDTFIEALKSFFIGVVEGITEWLPISSTGHMILVDEFVQLQVSEAFLDLFLVVIQIGAILAVIILYFHKLNPFSRTKTPTERRGTWRLWGLVIIGCIPAAILGLLLDDFFEEYFYNAWTVAIALIAYGIVFILLERHNRRRMSEYLAKNFVRGSTEHSAHTPTREEAELALYRVQTVDDMDWKTALKIGCFQMLAIIPGTSRSGSTIIGGMLCGCTRTAAAEFTFFLAIPVMLGWGLLRAIRYVMAGLAISATEVVVLVVGVLTAFVVSIIAIRFLMNYIKRNDFTAFGVYRIIIGIVVLAYFGVRALMGI